MSKTHKLIGIILGSLFLSQIIIIYLEGSYLGTQSNESQQESIMVERIIAPAAVDIILEKYYVNHFYKSEGFGINDVDPNDVTLAIHGTVDRLYQLIEYGTVWNGPISMSVFAPGLDASFVDDAIDGLRLCWLTLRKSIVFHVVYPQAISANMSEVGAFVYLSCRDIVRKLKRKKPFNDEKYSISYPHNVMRNIARSGVTTNWVLHLDTEIMPTSTLRNNFLNFIKKLSQTKK